MIISVKDENKVKYKYRNWSETAIDCFNRGYDCLNCPTQKLLSEKCKMKQSVLNLIATVGLPPKKDDLFPDFKNMPLKILKAIYDGKDTLNQLETELTTTRNSLITYMNREIYPYFKEKGFIRPNKNAFDDFIAFFKNFYGKETETSKKSEENIMFDEELQIKYAEFLKPLVNALKQGYESYDDLVRETGMTKHQISVYWTNLLKPLIEQGLIVRNQEKTQKQEIIDFVRNRLIDIQNGQKPSLKKDEENENKINSQKVENQPKEDIFNEKFTEMEQTVFDLLVQGLNYQQIAEKIPISPSTLKTHINNIFQKRNFHSLQDLLVSELKKIKLQTPDNKINQLTEELNRTKLLLEGKNAQYNSLLAEKEELKMQLQEIKESPKFTLFTPTEELSKKYRKQIDDFQALIDKIKIKLEVLEEMRGENADF